MKLFKEPYKVTITENKYNATFPNGICKLPFWSVRPHYANPLYWLSVAVAFGVIIKILKESGLIKNKSDEND